MFNSVPDDKLVLWNGRKLRELTERLQKLESKLGVRSKPGTTSRANSFVMVQNDSGVDWDRGRLVGIGDSLIKPGDITGDLAYERQNVFEWAATDETTKKFGICSSAAPAGRLAKVIVSGFANAVIDVTSLDHEYAKPTATDGVLESTSEPTSIRILFANAVGPTELCKVLLLGQPDSMIFSIDLQWVGGEDGTSETKASWRYNIRRKGSIGIILANQDPTLPPHVYRRPGPIRMAKADSGLAEYVDGELVVIQANEWAIFSECLTESESPEPPVSPIP